MRVSNFVGAARNLTCPNILPPTGPLMVRKKVLRTLLSSQISIAENLAAMEGKHSRAAMCAWDIVEELSRTLNFIERDLREMELVRDKSQYDEELSRREYDL
jgi:hypothetical protein